MDKETYKIFQVIDIFVNKYGYTQVLLKKYQNLSNNEAWLYNAENKFYQVIRISFSDAGQSAYEKQLEEYLEYFKQNSKIENIKFLDIHINTDSYNPDLEAYDYININENYHTGVDLTIIFPELYSSIHAVKEPNKEIQDIINKMHETIKQKIKSKPFFIRHPYYVTYIFIGICVINYILSFLLKLKFNDSSSIMVLLGAEYKTFTVGIHQYYRLLTYAFVHSDIIHLLCNMFSLFSIGRYVEYKYGHTKYLIALVFSIIVGGLTQGILSDNSICIGISAGIYGILVMFLIDVILSHAINFRQLIPTIFINLFLNFLSTTAWMAHLGGAIAGFAIYYCYANPKKISRILLCIVLLLSLTIKYVTIDSIKTLYVGTDFNVVNIINDLGFEKYAQKLLTRLFDAYSKLGG